MTRPLHLRPQQHASKLVMVSAAASLCTLLEAPAVVAQPVAIENGWQFVFNTNSGPVAPEGEGNWLTANIVSIEDAGGLVPNKVAIQLIANLRDPGEFISSVGFNLDGQYSVTLDSCSGDISCDDVALLLANPDKQPPQLNFANGIQGLDIGFDLPISNSSNRFQRGETVTFILSAAGLTPDSFKQTISDQGPLSDIYSAARVQGIKNAPGSTTITDGRSVPGPLPLLGVGVALAYCRRLRQRLTRAEGLV